VSAYITLASPMIDQEVLVQALAEVGFDASQVEIHETRVPLIGYHGDERPERAHVVIRREHLGKLSNDIGFERTPTGFRAHISDFDQRHYGRGWLRQLQDAYSRHDQIKRERLAQTAAADVEARRVAEIEARRRDRERRELIEAQRQTIHEKARSMGYRVEESRQGENLRLVLVKRVYS
jgi:hypothetical protein